MYTSKRVFLGSACEPKSPDKINPATIRYSSVKSFGDNEQENLQTRQFYDFHTHSQRNSVTYRTQPRQIDVNFFTQEVLELVGDVERVRQWSHSGSAFPETADDNSKKETSLPGSSPKVPSVYLKV